MNFYTMHRKHDPDTSREAAKSIVKSVTSLQSDVLFYAKDCGPSGFTDEDLNKAFMCWSSSYRSRRSELTARGLIVPSGRKKRLPSGRNAIVWIHKEYDNESAPENR
jgi:hypothetical protein